MQMASMQMASVALSDNVAVVSGAHFIPGFPPMHDLLTIYFPRADLFFQPSCCLHPLTFLPSRLSFSSTTLHLRARLPRAGPSRRGGDGPETAADTTGTGH